MALVLPKSSTRAVGAHYLVRAVNGGEVAYDLETQVAYVDARVGQAGVASVAARIRDDGVGLVLVLGDGPDARAVARVVRSFPETRFVFIDASLGELSLEGVANAAAIRFAEEDVLLLAGYLTGLVRPMDWSGSHIDTVSVVAAHADRNTERLLAGFQRGLRETGPGVRVRVDYSHELDDPTACERLANRQIDEGSDVVVALAGRCGLGAVEVARIRGVWSIGAEEDGIEERQHVLVSTYKDWRAAAWFAIDGLFQRSLPMGQDTVLGLEDDYAAGVGFSSLIPEEIASATVDRCSRSELPGTGTSSRVST